MSKYKFKITYRNKNKYGQYWGDNRYTVSIVAETLEQAEQKLDEIKKNDYGMHKNILEWEAEEITENKDKEIERLNNIIDKKEQFLGDNIKRLESEVVKRDNIISKLEKMLEQTIENSVVQPHIEMAKYTLKELKELKGSDKE